MKMFKENAKLVMECISNFRMLALTTLLLLSTLRVSPVFGIDAPEIYLVSSGTSTDFWNITAMVNRIPSVNSTFAYQIVLCFDTLFLECIESWIPKKDESWIFSELTTFSPIPTIDNEDGFVLTGNSILTGTPVSGSGPFSLATFNFHMKSQLKLNLIPYVNISRPDTYLLNEDLEEISPVKKTNACTKSMWTSTSTEAHSDMGSSQLKSCNSMRELADSLREDSCNLDEGSIEFIVGLNDKIQNSFGALVSFTEDYRSEIVNTILLNGKTVAVVVNVTREKVSMFQAESKEASFSTYVEPNQKVKAFMVPNDDYWEDQWSLQKIQADFAWNTTLGTQSILVAVVDSGIDYNHPDLADNYACDEMGNPIGYDWINDDAYPMDDAGHGTHCAGIIAGMTNNSEGVAGLAQVQIMAEKVINQYGYGSLDDVANGIINATDYGANIISLSLGYFTYSETLHNAVKYAYDHDVLLVAAAGNEAISCTSFPAYYQEVVAVTATDQNDTPTHFTNFGTWVELSAPGVNILSTISETHLPEWEYPYDYVSGTSMAAPHVAGIAALIWSQFPNITRDQVRIHLRNTADDVDSNGFDTYYGYGRVNAKKAVEQSLPSHDLLILHWTRTPYVKMGNITVDATVVNYGTSHETNVVIQLWRNDSMVTSKTISSLLSGSSTSIKLSCSTSSEGVYNVTVYIVPAQNETNVANNAVWSYVGTEYGTIKVPEYYQTIQEAVDVAESGDSIPVSPGTYNEAVHIQVENLSIRGASRESTVINGSGALMKGVRHVVYVDGSDYFYISGFTIQNSGISYGSDDLGRSQFDAGISLVQSNYSTITDNIIYNNREGIYLYDSYCTNITANLVNASLYGGIALWQYGSGNLIKSNTIESCDHIGIGLYVTSCSGDTVIENEVNGNTYGIDISCNSSVTGNKIVNNIEEGIYLWGFTGITLRDNHVKDNGKGISIDDYPTNNNIYWNNFINNTDQTDCQEAESNKWHGRWNVTGNYWSDYAGNDTDEDGIGDTPYTINGNNKDNFPFMNPYLPGDVNHAGEVDMKDIGTICRAYGTDHEDEDWNPKADLIEDDFIDTSDISIANANFGKTWQDYWEE